MDEWNATYVPGVVEYWVLIILWAGAMTFAAVVLLTRSWSQPTRDLDGNTALKDEEDYPSHW